MRRKSEENPFCKQCYRQRLAEFLAKPRPAMVMTESQGWTTWVLAEPLSETP